MNQVMKKLIYLISLVLLFSISSFGQAKNYLVLLFDPKQDQYGYKNLKGDTIIPMGKYPMCFTDTFKTYAIVIKYPLGFVAIDRKENVMYTVFPYDNGPDYTSEGLFRIIKDGKMGFADSLTGKIVIKPKYACALPFENGLAKVSYDCKKG